MDIGMTLPVTEPGWTRQALVDWATTIDSGPFSTLALGERMCFPTPEILTTLAACAVLTERVRLMPTVLVLPIHEPVVLAKQLATIDVFSDGRLTVGVGTGGREEDYRASGRPLSQKRISVMASHVETMRRVWAGEKVVEDTLRPVEPLPVQTGGPPVWAGVFGPKGFASAASWATGVCGMTMSASVDEAQAAASQAEKAWSDAGRSEPPAQGSSFWFAIGDDPDAQMTTHLQRYFNWFPEEAREPMARSCGFRGTPDQLREHLKRFEAAGIDELILIPTSLDTGDLLRAADVVDSL